MQYEIKKIREEHDSNTVKLLEYVEGELEKLEHYHEGDDELYIKDKDLHDYFNEIITEILQDK